MTAFDDLAFEYARCPEQAGASRRHPVVIVGAGPVGLTAAIDLHRHGIPVVLVDEKTILSNGSRAICWAKRTLEICDRLGVGQPLIDKGVTWSRGNVYLGDEKIYQFDLQPEDDHKRPAFINLQQFYFEQYLIQHAQSLSDIDLRWQHKIVDVAQGPNSVTLTIDTPDGPYTLETTWLIAADGVRSKTRQALGKDFEGRVFQDRFLIVDISMQREEPAIRRFWFNPSFHDGQSALMHKQADNVWRIDFQLGPDADPDLASRPKNVIPRIKKMLGDIEFEIVWSSVYTFTCRRMEKFRHGRIFFVGDAAHVVSPFGARGGNGGIQDTDNLVWKLAQVIRGHADQGLLDTYDTERLHGADENILNSTRSTDFMTPKNQVSRAFRNAVLQLARDHPFARRFVNGGRLSLPAIYANSPLNTADTATFTGDMAPGTPCTDAPITIHGQQAWLLDQLGTDFTLLFFGNHITPATQATFDALAALQPSVSTLVVAQANSVANTRYDARPGTAYLIRPDQHVAARWRDLHFKNVVTALDHCLTRT